MAEHTTEAIRNVALVGHAGTGKTTLVEALLHAAGAIPGMGTIERGNTVCDFDPQEKAHKHSLNAHFVSLDHAGAHVNLIDTPGYPDFLGRALSVLPAVETAALVLDASTGIDISARRLMEVIRERRLCGLIVVNRIDAPEADIGAVMADIRETFGRECLPVNLPADGGRRVVDCFLRPGEGSTDIESVAAAREHIVDQVVELDEALMELYLEQGQELDPERLHDAFERALREGHLIPVCFTCAATGTGVPELLNVIERLMPNPMEGNPPQFLKGEGPEAEPYTVTPDPGQHAVAHVFKVAIDNFAGRIGVFRMHQGTIEADMPLFVGDARKPFKVAQVLRVHGKDMLELPKAVPGDIAAVTKVDEVHFDAVLHDSHDEDHLHLRSIALPVPLYGLAIEAASRGQEQKLSDALHKLAAEDPCFVVEHHKSVNETVIRGLGELHLRMTLEKMQERYNLEVTTRPPRIAYRETIRAKAEGHCRHKKQTGGAGQFGEVYLRVEPLARGAGFEFNDAIVGGVIPHQLVPAVEKGVRQVLDAGAIAGYPLSDVRVTVYDGKHHPVDSKEVAFITAGRKAFLDAVKKAKPVVLEPIVDVEITAPAANMGDITGDLASRRGRINGTTALAGDLAVVTGQVPLSELSDYQSHLKSVTGGAGAYTMELSHYDPVPANKQAELTSAFHGHAEED